jgi:hypothetical protein
LNEDVIKVEYIQTITMNFNFANLEDWEDPNDTWGEVRWASKPTGVQPRYKFVPTRAVKQRRFSQRRLPAVRKVKYSAKERARQKWSRDKPVFAATQAARVRTAQRAAVEAARAAQDALFKAKFAANMVKQPEAAAKDDWYNSQYLRDRAAGAADSKKRKQDQMQVFAEMKEDMKMSKLWNLAKHDAAIARSRAQVAAEMAQVPRVSQQSSFELLYGMKPGAKFTRPK